MKKRIFIFLIILSIFILVVRFSNSFITQVLGFNAKSGVKIAAKPDADVFLDGNKVGRTPYQDENLKPGEYDIKLMAGDANWQGRVKLNEGTLSVVNRELAVTQASASGEVLTLNPGTGVVITTSPEGSEVGVDGKDYTKTPVSISQLPPGEHTFLFSHNNYLKRSVRAVLPAKMTLNLSVDLAILEADLSTVTAPAVLTESQVTVKQTPTGFLRVRDKPSLSGAEVGRVSPGDQLIMLEELSGWVRVRLLNNVEGYVSSSYITR